MSVPIEQKVIDVKSTPVDSVSIVAAMESRRREFRDAIRPHPRDQRSPRIDGSKANHFHPDNGEQQLEGASANPRTDEPQSKFGILLPIGKTLLSQWWSQHPARIGIQLAERSIEKQAREHPVALLAAGAALGSAIVIVKPWRRMGLASLFVTVIGAKSAGTLSKALEIAKVVAQIK
jgi:hypothetical protein